MLFGYFVEALFPHVTIGRVAQVMSNGDGSNKILIQAQSTSDCLGNRCNVETVLHTTADVIVLG